MKLRDVALWTINSGKTQVGTKYFYDTNWVIKGNLYHLTEVSCYADWQDSPMPTKIAIPRTHSMAHLNAVDISASPTGLDLSLDNDVLVEYDYILVQSNSDLYDESRIAEKQNFFLYKDDFTPTMIGNMRWFTIAFYNTKERRFEHNLRQTFDHLLNPRPTILKDKTLNEKIDEVIDDLTLIQRRKAIRKLKRMLNERL